MLKKIFFHIDTFARLLRLPNLLLIAASMYFVRYGLLDPVFEGRGHVLHTGGFDFALLVLSTLLIAAGGYIINDYFDIRIDVINRPGRVMLFHRLRLRTAVWIYYALTAAGCALGLYVSIRAGYFMLAFIHIASAIGLWFYSMKYKRRVLAGNITVAFLAALSLVIVWLFEFFMLRQDVPVFADMVSGFRTMNIFVLGFAAFAFLTSLIREMIKDIEDIEGDRSFRCLTLPIRYGLSVARTMILAVSIINVIFTAFAAYKFFAWGLSILAWYFTFVIGGLWLYMLLRFARAKQKKDYHYLSMIMKIIIIAGILSMQLVSISL